MTIYIYTYRRGCTTNALLWHHLAINPCESYLSGQNLGPSGPCDHNPSCLSSNLSPTPPSVHGDENARDGRPGFRAGKDLGSPFTSRILENISLSTPRFFRIWRILGHLDATWVSARERIKEVSFSEKAFLPSPNCRQMRYNVQKRWKSMKKLVISAHQKTCKKKHKQWKIVMKGLCVDPVGCTIWALSLPPSAASSNHARLSFTQPKKTPGTSPGKAMGSTTALPRKMISSISSLGVFLDSTFPRTLLS